MSTVIIESAINGGITKPEVNPHVPCTAGDVAVAPPRSRGEPVLLTLHGGLDLRAHGRGGRAGCRIGISEYPEPEVEPIEQRRRQPPQVPRALHVGAAAVGLDPTTRARVAARDQQEVGREFGGARRPADPHDALFERLAQRVEHGRWELGQLVEEECAMMRERDFARAGARASPADERDG